MSSGGCGVNPHSLHPSVITYVQSRVSGAMAAGTVMPTSFTCGGEGRNRHGQGAGRSAIIDKSRRYPALNDRERNNNDQ